MQPTPLTAWVYVPIATQNSPFFPVRWSKPSSVFIARTWGGKFIGYLPH